MSDQADRVAWNAVLKTAFREAEDFFAFDARVYSDEQRRQVTRLAYQNRAKTRVARHHRKEAAAVSKVVSLDEYRIRHGGDDAGFLGCPACGGDEFAVVCRGLPAKPFVAALICAECDPVIEIGVLNGYLGQPQQEQQP